MLSVIAKADPDAALSVLGQIAPLSVKRRHLEQQTLPQQPPLQPQASAESMGAPPPPLSLFSPEQPPESSVPASAAATAADGADGSAAGAPVATSVPARNTLRGWLLSASPPGGPGS